jgi:hypothetical protein
VHCREWKPVPGDKVLSLDIHHWTLATMVHAYRTMEDLKWWYSTCSQIMWFLCLGSRKLSLSAFFLLSIIHADSNELLP